MDLRKPLNGTDANGGSEFLPVIARSGAEPMTAFIARSASFNGRFRVPGPIETVFDLFSPLGERLWVPEWNPELLYPSGVSWVSGQIFRTQEEAGEAVWVVTRLRREAHEVEYH